MAAAKRTAAAGKPSLRPVEIQGDTVNIDDSKVQTWRAFELCSALSDPDASPFAKFDAAFELIGYATDTDKGRIVDSLGGDEASLEAVTKYAFELVGEIIPKN